MASANCSAAFGSRYSLRNFTKLLLHRAHFFQHFEDALRFFLIDDADGESDVDENVFTDFGLWRIGQIDFFASAAKINLANAERYVGGVGDFDDTARNSKTHEQTSAAKAAHPSRSHG